MRLRAKDMADRSLVTLGPVFGPILCIIMAVQHYFFWFLEWYDPQEGIDLVEDHWTKEQFEAVRLSYQHWSRLMYRKSIGKRGNKPNESKTSLYTYIILRISSCIRNIY